MGILAQVGRPDVWARLELVVSQEQGHARRTRVLPGARVGHAGLLEWQFPPKEVATHAAADGHIYVGPLLPMQAADGLVVGEGQENSTNTIFAVNSLRFMGIVGESGPRARRGGSWPRWPGEPAGNA